jgi:hypothetical protein
MNTLELQTNSQKIFFERQAKSIREELKNATQRLLAAELLLDTICTQFVGLFEENSRLKSELCSRETGAVENASIE